MFNERGLTMLSKSEILKSPGFILIELTIFILSAICMLIFPEIWGLCLAFFVAASLATYSLLEQQQKIVSLQAKLDSHLAKEEEYILRTEQLRRVLHDIRSPMSALRLRIQILQKTSCEPDKKHLALLEESLETAIDQVLVMSDIRKGKVKPSDTVQIRVDELLAHLAD